MTIDDDELAGTTRIMQYDNVLTMQTMQPEKLNCTHAIRIGLRQQQQQQQQMVKTYARAYMILQGAFSHHDHHYCYCGVGNASAEPNLGNFFVLLFLCHNFYMR